jgi:hypothetical protein
VVSRRGGPATTLDEVVANLPARFLSGKIDVDDGGEMVGLRDYMRELADYLRAQLGDRGPNAVVEVMTRLGIDPASWYRAALEAGAGAQILSRQAWSNTVADAAARLEEERAQDIPKPDLRVVQ